MQLRWNIVNESSPDKIRALLAEHALGHIDLLATFASNPPSKAAQDLNKVLDKVMSFINVTSNVAKSAINALPQKEAEKQAKAEALRTESLIAIAEELKNPALSHIEEARLTLAETVIRAAQEENGPINTDQIKAVLNQLNEGRAENDKIGQRFFIEETPKPNKLFRAANQVVDLAKRKISEIKNREAQKNAETMRKEVLGEIDNRIKAGTSTHAIDTARVIIVDAKKEDGSIDTNEMKSALNDLNKGLTDKIGERFVIESQSESTKNVADKALSLFKDGFNILSDKAVSLKERILPKTSLEDVDKKIAEEKLNELVNDFVDRVQNEEIKDMLKKVPLKDTFGKLLPYDEVKTQLENILFLSNN